MAPGIKFLGPSSKWPRMGHHQMKDTLNPITFYVWIYANTWDSPPLPIIAQYCLILDAVLDKGLPWWRALHSSSGEELSDSLMPPYDGPAQWSNASVNRNRYLRCIDGYAEFRYHKYESRWTERWPCTTHFLHTDAFSHTCTFSRHSVPLLPHFLQNQKAICQYTCHNCMLLNYLGMYHAQPNSELSTI